ncbi:histidine kinase [uncultured Imperialibacter sp.]|uniref:sensor histidine kinase n=1 Tax=uncultured Imperialibacter sp. TaxID=1672639 RepID=UPI0030DC78FE|tara:strand:- start:22249 stop:23322 length:1074 start_codon:yes stop_codon:yes gene_type:complete
MTEKKVLTGLIVICTLLALTVQLVGGISGDGARADLPIMYWPLGFGAVALLLVVPVYNTCEWLMPFKEREKLMLACLISILYGLSLVLLAPVVAILFERLFKVNEHFNFSNLPLVYASDWVFILPCTLFYFLQLLFVVLLRQKDQIVRDKEKVLELENQLKEGALSSLQYQLRPHFLFNSLNNVAMMVRKGEKEASVDALVSLSTILSKVMRRDKEQMIRLQEELDLLENFITIERLRDDKVSISVDVADGANAAMVPVLLLQPIVENAFRFARESGIDEPSVRINAAVVGQSVQLKVFNSGKGLIGWTLTDSSGIGLINTIHRLRYIYGTSFSFTTTDFPGGVEIVIEIPSKLERH